MARSLGIRLGQRSFEIVVLNGGPKKAKLDRHITGLIPFDAEDPIAEAAAAISEIIEEEKLPTDNAALVIETGLAAFRLVKLPFPDRAKIEEVIKFEVEGQLPQWEIDDVIVDFLVLSSNAVESNLVVTAVPKAELSQRLAICEAAGIEPLEAELECTAVVDTAYHAGLLDPESACLLVHFGDVSTSVVLIDGGDIRSIRAIHSGAFAVGSDAQQGSAENDAHLEEVALRLRREILRTISGAETTQPIEAVYIAGYDAPGLVGETIEGVPVEALRALPDTEPDEVEDAGRFYAAWGAAMHQLGGGNLTPSLRREELRFLGKFERLELPLAVLALLFTTFFGVRAIITHKEISHREGRLSTWLEASNNYMLGNPKAGRSGNLRRPSERIAEYASNALKGEVAQEKRFDQLQQIESMLQQEILAKQRELGQDVEISQPMSALEGMTLVLGVFGELGDSLGQFSIRRLDTTYISGKGNREDKITIKMDLTFRGSNTIEATKRYESFVNTVSAKPWFIEHKLVKESVLDTGDGIYVDGLIVTLDTTKAAPEEIDSTETSNGESASI